MGVGELYSEARGRITELVREAGEEGAAARVPGCPAWTVKDIVGHLTGVCADVLAGNLDGVATDPWTDAQVSARRSRSLEDVLSEWGEVAPQVEAMAAHFPEDAGRQWVADVTTHEHDIRGALDRPGARDSEGVATALEFLVRLGLDGAVRSHGLPALEVCAGDRSWVVGEGEPTGRLEAEPFELMRALTGRRSLDQLRGLGWTVDPEPYLPVFEHGPFRPSTTAIEE